MTTIYDLMKVEMDIVVVQDLLDYQLKANVKCSLADGQGISFVHFSEWLDRVRYPNIEKEIGNQLYDLISSSGHRLTYKLGELGKSFPIERDK